MIEESVASISDDILLTIFTDAAMTSQCYHATSNTGWLRSSDSYCHATIAVLNIALVGVAIFLVEWLEFANCAISLQVASA